MINLLLTAISGVLFIMVLLVPKTVLAYVRGESFSIEVLPIGNGFFLRKDAAQAFIAMQAAAKAMGIDLMVNSAFRTMNEQTRLWNLFQAGTGNTAARPGYSNHQNGIAVDIPVGALRFESPVYKWLQEHAWEYGFDNAEGSRINEPWHWVYTREI
jgi:LAS superfamily LD-carboxypeptidase LdcB